MSKKMSKGERVFGSFSNMKNLGFKNQIKYLKDNGKVGGVFDVWVELMIMFDNCGDIRLKGINEKDGEGKWRIYRESNMFGEINWKRCEKILNKNGIKFIEGNGSNGKFIDFEYKVGVI
jgi:hypothetical protein